MITRFKSIKPLSFWVFWKSWICLEYFCSLRKLLTLLADLFCNVKMRCSPKDDECRNPTNRWENVSLPLIPTFPCLTVEIFTGSSLHAGWDWEGPWGRGTPRNFPTTSVSDPENFQSFFFFLVWCWLQLFLWFCVMFKNLHYQVGGIRKSCGGAIWISYRPYPLLFPLTEALGLSQETQSPDRQNFSPSALYLG